MWRVEIPVPKLILPRRVSGMTRGVLVEPTAKTCQLHFEIRQIRERSFSFFFIFRNTVSERGTNVLYTFPSNCTMLKKKFMQESFFFVGCQRHTCLALPSSQPHCTIEL